MAQNTWEEIEKDAAVDLSPKYRMVETDDYIKPTKKFKLK